MIYHFCAGTVIVTRGRYLTPKEKNQASSERSLHLLIKGPKKQNLDRKNVVFLIFTSVIGISYFFNDYICFYILVAIQKIQSLIQRDKDMSKHPNLTSGPLINGAGIVSIIFSTVIIIFKIKFYFRIS